MRPSRPLLAGLTAALLAVGLAVGITVLVLRDDQESDPAVPVTSARYGQVATGSVVQAQEFDGSVVARWKSTVTVNEVAGSDRLVVNRIVGKADTVRVGQSLATISGRPLILLPGTSPGYRELVQGDDGADVTELRTAIGRLGCTSTDAVGRFGPSTAACVRWLYERVGSRPLTRAAQEQSAGDDTSTETGQDDAKLVVPWSELVYIPHETVRVATRSASVGKILQPGADLLTLSGGSLAVEVTTDGGSSASALTGASKVTLLDGQGQEIGPGVPGTMNAAGVVRVRFGKKVPAKTLAALGQGDVVLVRVVVGRSDPDGLIVPVEALTTTAAGEAAVQVAQGDPVTLTPVPVTVTVIANGQAAVAPLEEGTLADGQKVALG